MKKLIKIMAAVFAVAMLAGCAKDAKMSVVEDFTDDYFKANDKSAFECTGWGTLDVIIEPGYDFPERAVLEISVEPGSAVDDWGYQMQLRGASWEEALFNEDGVIEGMKEDGQDPKIEDKAYKATVKAHKLTFEEDALDVIKANGLAFQSASKTVKVTGAKITYSVKSE